jgi:hypothetical protein
MQKTGENLVLAEEMSRTATEYMREISKDPQFQKAGFHDPQAMAKKQ